MIKGYAIFLKPIFFLGHPVVIIYRGLVSCNNSFAFDRYLNYLFPLEHVSAAPCMRRSTPPSALPTCSALNQAIPHKMAPEMEDFLPNQIQRHSSSTLTLVKDLPIVTQREIQVNSSLASTFRVKIGEFPRTTSMTFLLLWEQLWVRR